ncbi:hypothetical protein, partial [Streptococcus pneumoniae]|uniref:hypothetical protein n=1 Tax=Streptococcus pneumoniae TaxID=1313 RepID=UPI001E4534BC
RQQSEDAVFRQTEALLVRKRQSELAITAGAAAGVIDIVSRMRDAITRAASNAAQQTARSIPITTWARRMYPGRRSRWCM